MLNKLGRVKINRMIDEKTKHKQKERGNEAFAKTNSYFH